jgi:MSHA biogenesis protein MshE
MARLEKIRLGEVLLQQHLITQEQLNQGLEEQKRSGRRLGRVLVEQGFVTEDGIAAAIARQLQIPYIDLGHYQVKPDLVAKLPETQARRFRALVLEDHGHALLVGMADPSDLFAYDELHRLLQHEIDSAAVAEGALLQTIDRVYRRTDEISGLAKELGQELGEAGVIDFGDLGLSADLEEAPVVKLLQTLFEDAYQVRASDIHIEPQQDKLQIRFRIDGVLHLQTEMDSKIAPALVLRLKLTSGLDIAEKRLPQDGRFHVKIRQHPVDVRISTMPTQYGESVVMRLLSQSGDILALERIGMPAEMLDTFRRIIHRPNGLVLVTGPTGSGKTTTLYAALNELNSMERKILTVEDPVEYRLPGINQIQVNEKIDLSFARVLRSTLRQDPDVILVGEMRDQETAQIGLRAAMTGHMVLSTLHTNDSASAPARLIDMGVPRFLVATSLQMVLAQRLVRLICEHCAEPYQPLPFEHEWLRLELGDMADEVTCRHGRGCTYCNGTGHKGRVAIYEMLEMTLPLVEAANHTDPTQFLRLAREQLRGKTLRGSAARTAASGRATVAEALRVSNQFED